jgi:hypothetical protein
MYSLQLAGHFLVILQNFAILGHNALLIWFSMLVFNSTGILRWIAALGRPTLF